ncbi:DNA internalization-related competence protein ComEC/Rec2 [Caballeronia terrestris]|uniref:DNA internalization-related competence protein ComEC/Rec2 n=1 Tax=Caballeronia terrestris TaxID=1226301 RepID=A0A158J141_9BURK|nr:DNA internalization-related competence protein ComEC/Rec2 [Caballeronia terrestris]SAL62568.1 DNA internalization-related competence protein ComEC/Rec2 [Caballeronia terrestris]
MRGVLLGFAAGVWCLQQQAVLPGWGFVALCALFCGACACFKCRRVALIVVAFAFGFAYAALRAEVRLQDQLPSAYEGRTIEVAGYVRGLPSIDADGTRFLFEVESNDARLRNFPRVVRLSWLVVEGEAPPPALWAGQRWSLDVRLKRAHGNANFGARDAEAALLARDIRATGYVTRAHRLPRDVIGIALAIDRLRAHLRDRIERVLGDAAHRGIVVALAVGAQHGVSDSDWTLMRATGTSHLVAISGLHIGFVAGLAALSIGFAWRRLRWRGTPLPLYVSAQKLAAAGAAAFAAFYAGLAGFNVPAQRSLWMLGFVAIAWVTGRRVASSLVLAWALALVLLADPWAVTAAGFWLSFCAVAAILYAMAAHGRRASKRRDDGEEASTDTYEAQQRAGEGLATGRRGQHFFAGWRRLGYGLRRTIASSTRVQYAVTVALAPLTVYWFSQIPLIGPLANAVAIPWVSLFVTPAVLAGVLLPAPLDAFAYRLAHHLLTIMCDALTWLAGPAWALWRLPQPGAFALIAAAIGVAWALAPRGWPMRFAAPLTWLPLLLPAPHAPPPGAFRLTALDIGQGSSIVVETARHALLFDAGPGPESTHAGERIVVPYLFADGLPAIDTLVISHSDSDHAGGAPAVLQAIDVRQLLASLPPQDALWQAANERGAETLRCAAGQHWTWDGVEFAILWPDPAPLAGKPNGQSCVLKVTSAAGRSALLAADIESDVERTLLKREAKALRADVLLVPHHGSKTSSTEPFLDSVEPLVAVFQVGYRNRFHHPHPTVFERYRLRAIELSQSDDDGAVRIEVSSTISLERYRQTHARYWMGR